MFERANPYAVGAGMGLPCRGTLNALERHGFIPVNKSDLEVDQCFVNSDGFTSPDYLTFRIRVEHSHAYAGHTSDGLRMQLMAGEYDARLTFREFSPPVGAEYCLQVVDAAQQPQGGDLWVKISEFLIDLEQFPDELPPERITVIDQRVTAPQEWAGAPD